jgi:hypothetical protein
MEDGTILSLPDVAANYLSWKVAFQDLSDAEANALRSFFASTQGSLQPFLFLDPGSNLLAWSEDFSQSAWQAPGITFDGSITDPLGTTRAARAHNPLPSSLPIAQQTRIPGLVQTCFSVYLRSPSPATCTLTRSAGTHSQNSSIAVTSTWQRFSIGGAFPTVTDPASFSITVPCGAALEIFGPQVDAQVNPSQYVVSSAQSGVYANSRFDMKQIDMIATGPNRNACEVMVRSNLPLENDK